MNKEKICILGASRGLGLEIAKKLSTRAHLLLLSRTAPDASIRAHHDFLSSDFSQKTAQEKVLKHIQDWNPERIFYIAGGGPYGDFSKKEWKDHQWALEVSFLFPARLIHFFSQKDSLALKQMAFVGSMIVENKPYPKGASYAAAKTALHSLIASLQEASLPFELKLFSPSYMDTTLLPPRATPRINGTPILSPPKVAQEFIHWCFHAKNSWHHEAKEQ
ncbi:MAG: SDR family NAD(P)-dependent oxidoreductase [Bdellovibrio sp.]|nr:MAG: SDR family NAD(P)-dependent oxidoreductase [Bdellovibrio sp.]